MELKHNRLQKTQKFSPGSSFNYVNLGMSLSFILSERRVDGVKVFPSSNSYNESMRKDG